MNFYSIRYWLAQILMAAGALLFIAAELVSTYVFENFNQFSQDQRLRLFYWSNLGSFLGLTLFLMAIIFAYYQMQSIDPVSNYATQVIRLGKFGLIMLFPVAIFTIAAATVSLFELIAVPIEFYDFILIFDLVGILIFILGTIILIYRQNPQSEVEGRINRGFSLISIGIFLFIFNGFVFENVFYMEFGRYVASAVVILSFVIWSGAIIYTNYLVRWYHFHNIETARRNELLYMDENE